ncbi:hypothetical protein BG004_000758, partial [Podila humilis]
QPQPCGGAAFARVGNKFYIQGGATSGDHLLASLWSLDLSTTWTTSKPSWSSLALGPFNAYHSGGYTADNSTFITFGRDTAADPQVIPQAWVNVYDIASNSWTFSSNPTNMQDNSRRDFSVVTNAGQNKIYILGGNAGPSGETLSNMFSIYDPMSRTLVESPTAAPGPQSISTYAAVWVPRMNAMVVIGGVMPGAYPSGLYIYHPDTGAWSTQATTGSFTYARTAHCAASNADGSLIAVFGGFVTQTASGDPYVFILDTRTWAWTTVPYHGRGRGNTACAIVDDTFIVWGGYYNNPNTVNGVPMGDEALLLFQLSTSTWQTTYTPSPALAGGNGSGGGSGGGSVAGGAGGAPSGPTPPSKGPSTAVIGGIAAGVVAFLVVIAFTLYDRHRRQKKGSKLKDQQEMAENFHSNDTRFEYSHPNPSDNPVHPRPSPTVPIAKYTPLKSSVSDHHPHQQQHHEARPSVDGCTSNVAYSDPATPTTLQFLAMGEQAHGDGQYAVGRQSYMSDGSVYYPPPPAPGHNSNCSSNQSFLHSQAVSSQGGRPSDPHSIVVQSYVGNTNSSSGGIGSPYQSHPHQGNMSANQYHDGGGYMNSNNNNHGKHSSMMSSQSGFSDGSCMSNPQSYGHLLSSPTITTSGGGTTTPGYQSTPPPPMPMRPVSNPQGGHGFGSVAEPPTAVPGNPHALLQYQASLANRR